MNFRREKVKKEKRSPSERYRSESYFWYEVVNFHNRVLTSMLRFKLVVFLDKHEVIEWYDTK